MGSYGFVLFLLPFVITLVLGHLLLRVGNLLPTHGPAITQLRMFCPRFRGGKP